MSTSPAKILQFPSGTEVADASSLQNDYWRPDPQPIVDKIVKETESSSPIGIDDLYPEMLGVRPELDIASRLLARSLADLDEAAALSAQGDLIVADDAVQRFQAALPELFSCRDLSDSFGALVGAAVNALNNQRGNPLSIPQIKTLRDAVGTLRSEPFMKFDAAVEKIMRMEDAGFVVEPPEFEVLTEWLDE